MTNADTGIRQTTVTDGKGFYSFPNLSIGNYEIEIASRGFRSYRRTGIVIDANSALRIDAILNVGEKTDTILIIDNPALVDTLNTQNGQVIYGTQMTAVPLNGRSFTDLLTLQPGVAPSTSITSQTVQDVGASVLSPSGDLNPGTISINGQREFANSFIVNGSDVQEDVNMGAAIVPNLDSIAEFRILTNNFDAEYGEFSGG
ncbi:MAG: carboxypeptidase-like regulatory domain-containing protein, partial [Candidatus Acidiferrum sp.]